jgi:hypothetical protein
LISFPALCAKCKQWIFKKYSSFWQCVTS